MHVCRCTFSSKKREGNPRRHRLHAMKVDRLSTYPTFLSNDAWRGNGAPIAPLWKETLMHTRAHTVPRWIQRGEPEPYPGAFRDFVARLDEKPCCPVARVELRALRAFLDAPAGLCLRCGGMGAWRRGWTSSSREPRWLPPLRGLCAGPRCTRARGSDPALAAVCRVELRQRRHGASWLAASCTASTLRLLLALADVVLEADVYAEAARCL